MGTERLLQFRLSDTIWYDEDTTTHLLRTVIKREKGRVGGETVIGSYLVVLIRYTKTVHTGYRI